MLLMLVCSLAGGLGVGLGAWGLTLRAAGLSAEVVDWSSIRWVLPAAIAAVVGSWLAGACLSAEGRVYRRVCAALAWIAVAAALILAAVSWGDGVPEPDEGEPLTNAPLFGHLARYAFLGSAVFLAVPAVALRPKSSFDHAMAPRSPLLRWIMGLAAAGALVLPGLALPPWVDNEVRATNTDFLPPSDAPGELTSSLDGDVAWSANAVGGSAEMMTTSGGIAAYTQSPVGIQMLDPKTGQVRWSWSRDDLVTLNGPMVASVDGDYLAARFQTVSQSPAPPSIVVFDAMTGDVQAELPEGLGRLIALTEDRVVTLSHGKLDLTAHDFTGERLWGFESDREIRTDDETFSSFTDDTVLITQDPAGRSWGMAAVDMDTGELKWEEDLLPEMSPLQIVPGADLAVSAGLEFTRRGTLVELETPPSVRVLALGLDDGEQEWEQSLELPDTVEGDIQDDGCSPRIDPDPAHLTVLSCADRGNDVQMSALDPLTGDVHWEQELSVPDDEQMPRAEGPSPMHALPGGHTALTRPTLGGCVIMTVGEDETDETPLRSPISGCGHTEWRTVGETVLLRDPGNGLFALH